MTPLEPSQLVLSLFPGIGLLDLAFEATGFVIVRGPDLIWGGDVTTFTPLPGRFDGVIGGSPCQDFSRARRSPPTGNGLRLLAEFVRCVESARPAWFVLENVPGVPSISPNGYVVQRLNLTAHDVGLNQNRNRCFQFGSLDGIGLVIPRSPSPPGRSQPCCTASEGTRKGRRSWAEFCEAQGLPPTFDIPAFTRGAKYRAVGNGVPLPMGRAVALAVATRHYTQEIPVCVCDCGRPVTGKQLAATAACRKRLERRRRDAAGVIVPGPDTSGPSQRQLEGETPPRRHSLEPSRV